MSDAEFAVKDVESVSAVLSLSSGKVLVTWVAMWFNIFIWCLFSYLWVHLLAALIAFCQLRRHKFARWVPVLLIVVGFVTPITGGALTSAVIAGVYRASDLKMDAYHALVWGCGQTLILLVFSFTRLLATL